MVIVLVMNKHEMKIEQDNTVRLTACRLKGHDLLYLYPMRWTPRQIEMAKRKIFEGKIASNTFLECMNCSSPGLCGQVRLATVMAVSLKRMGTILADAAKHLKGMGVEICTFNIAIENIKQLNGKQLHENTQKK